MTFIEAAERLSLADPQAFNALLHDFEYSLTRPFPGSIPEDEYAARRLGMIEGALRTCRRIQEEA